MNVACDKTTQSRIRAVIEQALSEDIGTGDVTTLCIVPEHQFQTARLLAKEDGIIAGMDIVKETFAAAGDLVVFSPSVKDGERVTAGQDIARVCGPSRVILSAERTVLNILQRMSGIATATGEFVKAVAGTSAVILDTRKTTPGLRFLDKLAVKIGGGQNHRFGLFDMVLIKENHISSAGSISEAVNRIRRCVSDDMQIEVEVKNIDELREALDLNVDRILLDNMPDKEMEKAVQIAGGLVPLEASGNVTLERVRQIAGTGVDYISVGSLTHSVKALDISLLMEQPGV